MAIPGARFATAQFTSIVHVYASGPQLGSIFTVPASWGGLGLKTGPGNFLMTFPLPAQSGQNRKKFRNHLFPT